MKLLLTTLDGNIYPIEVSADLELINLKALCEQETSITMSDMSLSHDGRPLTDDALSLAAYNIAENDIIMVQRMRRAPTATPATTNVPVPGLPNIDFGAISVPPSLTTTTTTPRRSAQQQQRQPMVPNMDNMRQMLMADPVRFETIRARFPELAAAIQNNDTG